MAIDGLDCEMPIYPRLDGDAFGQQFLKELATLPGTPRLATDAPWFVRVRGWRPQSVDALVVHWINYLQDEGAAVEIPIPIGPLQVECEVPDGCRVERVEWIYPEMREAAVLQHEEAGSKVRFSIPRLIVYGVSVLYLHST